MFFSKRVGENQGNKRLDLILVELKMVSSRQKAVSLIITGNVFVSERKIEKPGKLVKSNELIKVKKKENKWVSRGGIKLSNALKTFSVKVNQKVCMDIGCSTGGFTHVLLSGSAKKIYAIDVGYGQFDWELRKSERINLLEKTNARYIDSGMIKEKIDLMVCDVSFISLKKVLAPCKVFLAEKYEIICLIKPQFELKKSDVGKGGIIRDEVLQKKICDEIKNWFEFEFQPKTIQLAESIIKGQKGNREFFIYAKK